MDNPSLRNRLTRTIIGHRAIRDPIVNGQPKLRALAVTLGRFEGNLPIFYAGDTIISEHLSIDARFPDAVGDIGGWYDRCLAMLDSAVGSYPDLHRLTLQIARTSVRFPLHFAPVHADGIWHVTTTYHDGKIEEPFFKYVRRHMDTFIAKDRPPCTMYFLLQLRLPGREEYLPRAS